ncbi:MAG: MFS transporter [Planctomycetota bacterium]|jgi:MFS family permease
MRWREKSYEVLPALSVRRAELRRSMQTVTVAYMFAVAYLACISGSHIKVFARMLGFNDLAFGLMSAIPFLATFAQLPATITIERTGLRKYQFIYCMGLSRVLWFVAAAIPLFLPIPSAVAVAVMLLVLVVSCSSGALAFPAWMSWMGDLIPRRVRGRYLGARAKLAGVTQLFIVVALGIVLDAVTVKGAAETHSAQPVLLWVICCFLAAGAVLGIWDVLLFRRIRELRPTVSDKPPPPAVKIDVPAPKSRTLPGICAFGGRYLAAATRQLLLDPLRDRVFRHYVCYGATITFAMTVGGWFYWLNAMENLGFSKLGANVLFLGVGSLAGIAASRLWGRLIDHWGRRPTLILATIGTVFSPIPWLLVKRDTPAPAQVVSAFNWLSGQLGAMVGRADWQWIGPETPLAAFAAGVLACIIGGACWRGIDMAKIGITMGFADGQGRSKYIAASSVLISIGGVLGGIVGGLVAQSLVHMQNNPLTFGPFLWKNWHVCFAISILARASSILWLVGMPDPGSGKFRAMIRLMGANAYNAAATRLFYPLRVFGWRRRQRNSRDRQGGK